MPACRSGARRFGGWGSRTAGSHSPGYGSSCHFPQAAGYGHTRAFRRPEVLQGGRILARHLPASRIHRPDPDIVIHERYGTLDAFVEQLKLRSPLKRHKVTLLMHSGQTPVTDLFSAPRADLLRAFILFRRPIRQPDRPRLMNYIERKGQKSRKAKKGLQLPAALHGGCPVSADHIPSLSREGRTHEP